MWWCICHNGVFNCHILTLRQQHTVGFARMTWLVLYFFCVFVTKKFSGSYSRYSRKNLGFFYIPSLKIYSFCIIGKNFHSGYKMTHMHFIWRCIFISYFCQVYTVFTVNHIATAITIITQVYYTAYDDFIFETCNCCRYLFQ